MYEVKKGVEIPQKINRYGRYAKYPWKTMLPWDCFDVPSEGGNLLATQRKMSNCAVNALGKGNFATRIIREEGVVRVWRTK